ncbi:MAG: hypothetical protein IPG68_13010 [Micrococcales bacterium]|nr:hypothetical protein [Micrococcales bacterium]
MKKIIATGAAAALLAGGGLAVTQPASAAKKYTACVKKSTGEMRLLLGKSKKCKKGWKKRTWTKAGPTGGMGPDGPVGPANSFGYVVDGKGTIIGRSMGTPNYPIPVFPVLIEGGLYFYYPNGWLIPGGAIPYFDNAACTGTPFAAATDTIERDIVAQDPTFRVVSRGSTATSLLPARAYKVNGPASSVLNQTRYYLNSAEVCTAEPAFTGYLIPLVAVTAPPDYPGPLKVV